jgi:hypothetical protein
MFESEPRIVPVECDECSLRTFVRRKESGLANVVPAIAPTCRHPPVVTCASLKIAFLKAHASVRNVR